MSRFRTTVILLAALLAVPLVPERVSAAHLGRDFAFPGLRHGATSARVGPQEARRSDVGSSNTVTADPLVVRPSVAPCVAKLFTGSTFAQYAPQTFAYRPPAGCPGPFQKIVFNADFSVSAGRQFDRTASVEIGNVPLYFGTTAEPRRTLSPAWHVERDVTDDAALLAAPHAGEADIFNIVDATYTGVITGSAYVQFYPAGSKTVDTPDVVLPVPNSAGGPQHLPREPAS